MNGVVQEQCDVPVLVAALLEQALASDMAGGRGTTEVLSGIEASAAETNIDITGAQHLMQDLGWDGVHRFQVICLAHFSSNPRVGKPKRGSDVKFKSGILY